jgi:hypothetical protein
LTSKFDKRNHIHISARVCNLNFNEPVKYQSPLGQLGRFAAYPPPGASCLAIRLLLVPIGVGVGIGIGIDSDWELWLVLTCGVASFSWPNPIFCPSIPIPIPIPTPIIIPTAIGTRLSCIEKMSKPQWWAVPTIRSPSQSMLSGGSRTTPTSAAGQSQVANTDNRVDSASGFGNSRSLMQMS